jgi:hypothetical protein
LFSSS